MTGMKNSRFEREVQWNVILMVAKQPDDRAAGRSSALDARYESRGDLPVG
jgi:hypothetical protein